MVPVEKELIGSVNTTPDHLLRAYEELALRYLVFIATTLSRVVYLEFISTSLV